MKKLGIASMIAGALTAAVVGLAGPAQADIGHHDWASTVGQPNVYVPHVDTTVHH
jgi:hypothetical protein